MNFLKIGLILIFISFIHGCSSNCRRHYYFLDQKQKSKIPADSILKFKHTSNGVADTLLFNYINGSEFFFETEYLNDQCTERSFFEVKQNTYLSRQNNDSLGFLVAKALPNNNFPWGGMKYPWPMIEIAYKSYKFVINEKEVPDNKTDGYEKIIANGNDSFLINYAATYGLLKLKNLTSNELIELIKD